MKIDLTNTELTVLDISLFDNIDITELECKCNKIKSLPSEIDNLINLQELDCNNNQIESLPSEIGNLINLQQLICNNNQIKSLPSEITNLISLQIFDCGCNQIVLLPSEIDNLVNLQELYCNNNQIVLLPSEITNLINLRKFTYSNNPIEHIPPNVMRLIQRLENRHHNAQNIYRDTQNVHNHTIQSCIKNSIKNILNHKPCIKNHIEYILQDNILDNYTKNILIEYSQDANIHTELGISFDELLKYVISRIHENEHRNEIKRVLNNEMKDASCMCFTGRISRLVNCLNGFDKEIVITISDSEQISQIIILIKQQLGNEYTIEKHKELVLKSLLEREFSSDKIDTWIDSIE